MSEGTELIYGLISIGVFMGILIGMALFGYALLLHQYYEEKKKLFRSWLCPKCKPKLDYYRRLVE